MNKKVGEEGREKEERRQNKDKALNTRRVEKGKNKQRSGTCSLVPLALLAGTHHKRHERWARDLRER